MERGATRDINELLLNGFFKTARGKSPSRAPTLPPKPPAYLSPTYDDEPVRERRRSRSRNRSPSRVRISRGLPPPPPSVEDEVVSLAREHLGGTPSDDPPMRGIVEQNPIILEAEVTEAEATRLQGISSPKDREDENPERRFVFIPRSDTGSSNSEEDIEKRKRRARKRDSGKSFQQDGSGREQKKEPPPMERRRTSRQDLPALETKVPREIPPQFRRSASAFASTPKDSPKTGPPRQTGEYFLSPEVMRNGKDSFTPSQSAPRYERSESFGGRAELTPVSDKRNSGSFSGSRPTTPSADKRNSGNFESGRRSRRTSNDRLTRPQQLSGEDSYRKSDRQSERISSARSSRSSVHSNRRYYSSSDDEFQESDSDRQRRRRHRTNQLHPEDERHIRSSSRVSNGPRPGRPTSRYTSPLPSPKVSPSQLPTGDYPERSGTFPIDRNSRSRPVSPNDIPPSKSNPYDTSTGSRPTSSRQSTTVLPIPMPVPMSSSQAPDSNGSLPIPIPSRIDVHSPGETRRSPAIPQYNERPTSARPEEKEQWPPKFEPPTQTTYLDKPVGSYRRYSEEVERGAVTPLPTCPRKSAVRGRNDWLTLPQCSGFDICPSCYNSTMAPTEFRNMFVPAPFRSPDAMVLCDFGSSPWYRIAWLLTLKERRRDLDIFYGLARVASSIPPCSGSHQAMRQWHSMIDPKTRSPIANFDVCTSCVRSIEVLLPSIRGIFIPTNVHLTSNTHRICDLRFDSKRFVQYFDALETTADQASYHNIQPDTRNLASLVRRFASVEECQKDIDLRDTRWHIITQLPEFTVCEECFEEIVWPELESGKAIPDMFNKTVQRLPKASCQLYSPKMRGIFRTAVDGDDYKLLAGKARERKAVELAYKKNLAELRRMSGNAGIYAGSGSVNPGWVKDELARLGEEWRKWE